MQASTETFNETKLREIADQPGSTVYAYEYDEPETILDAASQIALYRSVVAAFDGAAIAYPDNCDEALREKLMRHPRVRQFQRLYPKVFASSTVRAHDADMEARLDTVRKMGMVILTERWKGEGDEDQKAARAMHTGMRMAMRDTKAEDLEGAVKLDSAAEDAGVDASQMRPLSRFELGPSTVRQA